MRQQVRCKSQKTLSQHSAKLGRKICFNRYISTRTFFFTRPFFTRYFHQDIFSPQYFSTGTFIPPGYFFATITFSPPYFFHHNNFTTRTAGTKSSSILLIAIVIVYLVTNTPRLVLNLAEYLRRVTFFMNFVFQLQIFELQFAIFQSYAKNDLNLSQEELSSCPHPPQWLM